MFKIVRLRLLARCWRTTWTQAMDETKQRTTGRPEKYAKEERTTGREHLDSSRVPGLEKHWKLDRSYYELPF